MSISLNQEKSAMAYLEQATQELSKNMTFTHEKDFNDWVSNNFESIVKRASALNLDILSKVLNNPASKEEIVHKMALNIHTALNK
jgi:hypothetical protein